MSNPFASLVAQLGSSTPPPMPTNAVSADALRHQSADGDRRGARPAAPQSKSPPADGAKPTMPKFVYSRQFLLKVARQSQLLDKAPSIMPELLRPLAEAGPIPVPAVPAGVSARGGAAGKPGSLGGLGGGVKPSIREVESLRDRDRASDRPLERRWNDPREREERQPRERGERGERAERPARDGTYDSKGRFESTPSWAHTEVKNALDDDDTFGGSGGSAGEFVFGTALDRDADAKIMNEMGWGEMFRATADLERQAEEEREEIRRQMAREHDDDDHAGSSDFTELPPDHPLMMQKAAAAAAASRGLARTPSDLAAALASSTVSDDDELAKLDELLAAKAASAKGGNGSSSGGALGSVAEEHASTAASYAASSTHAVRPAENTWTGSVMRPHESQSSSSPESDVLSSNFASRFGFGLQDDASSTWGVPLPSGGASKSSTWGFPLEETERQPDAAMLHKFASTPNTIHTSKPPQQTQQSHHHQQQQQQQQQPTSHHHASATNASSSYLPHTVQMPMQIQSHSDPSHSHLHPPQQGVYVKVAVGDMFSNFGSANTMPAMPSASTAPMSASAVAAAAVEDPLQRLVSKHRNRKATTQATPVQQMTHAPTQILPHHLLAHQQHHQAGHYPPGVAAGVAARYDAPPVAAAPSLLSNPAFLNLPPHQQQQYLRHWEQQQMPRQAQPHMQQQQHQYQPTHQMQHQAQHQAQQQQPQQQPQHASMQQYAQHYVSAGPSPYSNQPLQSHQPQQPMVQPVSQQPLPPGMLRRPLMQNPTPQQTTQSHQQQQHPRGSQNHPQLYQPPGHPPLSQQQQQLVHGRLAPNHGVVPTTYSAQPQQPPQQQQQAADPNDLSRWFGQMQQANMPTLPAQAQAMHYQPNMYKPQQRQ